ncbi:hypothetical protein GCM10009122_38810 [Fulvivirga kasyanovii]|uniref:Fibronectin type-III domain-containing protein n=1 Tax=Fulvivirga kasyanovii TaxID=396812 RepID=A0ABW9RSA4_9BACT|nr:hypothetical protein [Fulvivirga kasyanovii]MTI27038.1 hypothetical protein [Fulvivirga kasyanovii]
MRIFLIIVLFSIGVDCFAQKLPVPQGLTAKVVNHENSRAVVLTWNKSTWHGGELGYNLLVKFPDNNYFLLYQDAGVIYDTTYTFEVADSQSSHWQFAVMAVENFPEVIRSTQSEPVDVILPSLSLPNIEISSLKYENGVVTLVWDYSISISDLKGYNIYVNDDLIDTVDKKGQMAWTDKFQGKGKYIFQISAVSNSGVESSKSQKKLLKIE